MSKLEKRIRSPENLRDDNTYYKIGVMAMMAYSLPRNIDRVDAMAVYPGMGEIERVTDVVGDWNRSISARHLFVGGVYEAEDTFDRLTEERLKESTYGLRRTDGVVIQQKANHTKEQADWIAAEVKARDIASLALYAPAYHLLRAYATTVKSMDNADVRIPIIPMPTRVSPDSVSAETGMNTWEMAPAEMERIAKYQEKGDVATKEELQDYINWSWKQPLFSDTK